MSLLTRISVPPPDSPEAEDIFSSALTTIFTDDAINSWGSPGASVTYSSPRYGAISLNVPIHPDEEQGRRLFAHYLWNSGVVAADAIESASSTHDTTMGEVEQVLWDRRYWDVRDKRVLEIGAATALPSLIAALCGALSVTITDHPSSPALTAGGIQQNVKHNLYVTPSETSSPHSTAKPAPRTESPVFVYGYTWGTSIFYDPTTYGRPAPPPEPATLPPNTPLSAKGYPRPHKIIVADCLWMPSQHSNIIQTILDLLPENPPAHNSDLVSGPAGEDESTPAALIVAGFHTGRAIVRDFFALAVSLPSSSASGDDDGAYTPTQTEADAQAQAAVSPENDAHPASGKEAKLKLAEIFETDMEGNRRAWVWDDARQGEGKWEAKRWCVVGVLVRA